MAIHGWKDRRPTQGIREIGANTHMRKPNTKNVPLTRDLRDRLKSIVETELDRLPDLLEGLTDKERLDVILRLMPLVVPKAKPVHYQANEPSDWPSFV